MNPGFQELLFIIFWTSAPLTGGDAGYLPEITVEGGGRGKAALICNVYNRLIRILQIIACGLHPHQVNVLQGAHVHIFGEQPPEMGFTDMTPG